MEDLPVGNIGPAVRRAREARGLTQQTLATNAGIALRTLIRIEQGEDMRIGTLITLANELGITLADLVATDAA
jgi:transcriptional regulator with XRE-family HTH domain